MSARLGCSGVGGGCAVAAPEFCVITAVEDPVCWQGAIPMSARQKKKRAHVRSIDFYFSRKYRAL